MPSPNHEQVNLMLHLYELRREPRLRQAREWMNTQFYAATPEEMFQKYPMGTEGSTNFAMVASYWEMVAAIANRGLIDEDLFFETTGEQWFVWERIKHLIPAFREKFKHPQAFGNLEENCRRFEAWRERRAPGSSAAMREMIKQMNQARASK